MGSPRKHPCDVQLIEKLLTSTLCKGTRHITILKANENSIPETSFSDSTQMGASYLQDGHRIVGYLSFSLLWYQSHYAKSLRLPQSNSKCKIILDGEFRGEESTLLTGQHKYVPSGFAVQS